MKNVYSESQSETEVIILKKCQHCGHKQAKRVSEESETWVYLSTFEKTQDLQRRRLAFLHG